MDKLKEKEEFEPIVVDSCKALPPKETEEEDVDNKSTVEPPVSLSKASQNLDMLNGYLSGSGNEFFNSMFGGERSRLANLAKQRKRQIELEQRQASYPKSDRAISRSEQLKYMSVRRKREFLAEERRLLKKYPVLFYIGMGSQDIFSYTSTGKLSLDGWVYEDVLNDRMFITFKEGKPVLPLRTFVSFREAKECCALTRDTNGK